MNEPDIQRFFSLRNEYRSLRYDLRNTEVLCSMVGDPQKSFRSVLIAGTNGKGSVASFLSGMMPEAGLYVSPHLERLNERISIGGREIDDDALGEAFEVVGRASKDGRSRLLYPPTYFERLTAMAFWYFRDRASHVVVEVGLGGRLDATHVVRQDVSVITNVGWDHQEYLGSTLAQIAGEKAGIINDSEPVVTGSGCDFDVIRTRAGDRLVRADRIGTDVRPIGEGYYEVDIRTPVARYPGLRPRLPGRHQIDNLCVAIRAAECLEEQGWPIDSRAIVRGANSATWPGRLERVSTDTDFLLDGGHNAQAAEALARFLGEHHPDGVCLIFGAMEEKDCRTLIETLRPHATRLILTRTSHARAADPSILQSLAPGAVVAKTVEDALRMARRNRPPGETVLVTGSLYLVGKVRAILNSEPSAPRPDHATGVASGTVSHT